MARRSNRNNVIAGTFLVGSLALAVLTSFWLGGLADRIGKKAVYAVQFPMDVGVPGLQEGSPVRLAGMDVGRVTSVGPVMGAGASDGEERVVAMRAEIAIRPDVLLYEDALATLTAPILGGLSSINLRSVGTGIASELSPDDDAVLEEGEAISGIAAPGLLAQVGFGPEEAEKLRAVLRNVEATSLEAQSFLARLDDIASELQPDAKPAASDVRTVLSDLRSFSENLNRPDGWAERIEGILADGEAGAERLPSVLEEADGFLKDGRGLLRDNRDAIDLAVADTQQIIASIREQTIPTVNDAVSSYAGLGDRLNVIVTREYPQVRGTLENVRGLSAEARAAVSEFRAQPWRILDSPSAEEMEREPIFAAARSYAGAVSELRAASEALEAALGASGDARLGAPDADEIARMAEALSTAFGRYESAEQELLRLLSP